MNRQRRPRAFKGVFGKISSSIVLLAAALCSVQAAHAHAQQREQLPSDDARRQTLSDRQQDGVRVDVDDLAENPGKYVGKTVRVQGEIEELIAPRVLTLDEDSLLATTDILVILPRPSVALRDDSDVVVQGAVHQMTRAQLEQNYGMFAGSHWAKRYDRKPVIVATSLQTQQGTDLLLSAKASEDVKRGAALTAVEPGAVARAPDKYFGRLIAVRGEIEDVFSPYVFTLDEDELFAGPDALVITRAPAGAIADGVEVRVSGVLRRFKWAELRGEYDFLGLDSDHIRQFEGRPVILADGVWRTPGD